MRTEGVFRAGEKYRKNDISLVSYQKLRYIAKLGNIVSFRYDNDMNFLIARYIVLYRIYDIYIDIFDISFYIEYTIYIIYIETY